MVPDGENAALPPARRALRDLITLAWQAAGSAGSLPAIDEGERPPVEVAHPADPAHGDLATNLALKLARPMRRSPLAIAESLAAALRTVSATTPGGGPPLLAEVSAVAPGFVNVRLSPAWLEAAIDGALADGTRFGRLSQAQPRHINVEFVSANPTGPLHIGNARGAFVGDLLCRVLEGAGHQA